MRESGPRTHSGVCGTLLPGPLRPRPAWTRGQRARTMWQMTRAGGRVRHRSRGVRNELLVEQFAHGTAHVFPQLPGVGDLHEGQAGAPVRQCTRACSALARPRNAATPRPPCPSAQAYHALLGDAMRRARNARHRPELSVGALRETRKAGVHVKKTCRSGRPEACPRY